MMRLFIRKFSLLSLLLVAGMSAGCTSLFFFPQKQLLDNPIAQSFLPKDVYFRTADGLTLHGWFFEAKARRASILVLHGNAENLSTHVNSVLWLVQEGFNIFIIDYRGYGKSEGKPDIEGVHRDAEAALDALFSLPPVDKNKVVVLGQSLGGAVAVHTVANSPRKDRVKALIVESAFSSYRAIAREKLGEFWLTWPFQYPLSFFFADSYSPVKWIQKVSPVPVLILHGENDPVVPARHGRILYEAAGEPKEYWRTEPEGHISSFADEQVRKRLVSFIDARVHGLQRDAGSPIN
jgi:fermentation-respiration switch protein FrsA (DUF1100 family)